MITLAFRASRGEGVAQEAPALYDRSDQELERLRQALSYDVIWGKGGASAKLAEIERELDRRARARAEERRAQAAAAREKAWRKMQEEDARREARGQAMRAAEEERLRAEEERRHQEEERRHQEEGRRHQKEEQRRQEEEERARAERERREQGEEVRKLAAEQLQTARLLDFGTKRIVELAAEYVEREDAIHALAPEDESDRFTQAQRLLGASLRARLAAIPELRLKPDTSPNGNGGSNGRRTSLEDRTRSVLGDLLPPADD
jgi:hypothetical protein